MTTRVLAVLAALAATAFGQPARAADPVPAPCNDTLYTDPAGDQLDDPIGFGDGAPSVEKGQDNMDIKSVFLNYQPNSEGKQVLTANIQVANLTKDIPDRATGGLYYYLSYGFGDESRFVTARLTSSGVTYNYGHLATIPPDPAPIGLFTAYTVDGASKGSFVEGPDGVVSIEIPEAVGGKVGDALVAPVATIDMVQIDDEKGWQSHADQAPDDSDDAKDTTVAACPAADTTTNVVDATPVTTVMSAAPAPAAPALTTLPFKAATLLGSAKKAKKRPLAFKVTTTSAISNLLVKLTTAKGKVLGRVTKGMLAAGTSTLKLRARGLKAGSYKLVATGDVDGLTLATTQAVKVKK